MKLRKLLVIVCVCTLVLGLFGLNALAETPAEYTNMVPAAAVENKALSLQVGSDTVTDENGTVITASNETVGWHYDQATNTLTLNNCNLGDKNNTIDFDGGDLIVKLEGTSSLKSRFANGDPASAFFFGSSSHKDSGLYIVGPGTLNIDGNISPNYAKMISISGGATVNAAAVNGSSYGDVSIVESTVTVNATGQRAIDAGGSVTIEKSKITVNGCDVGIYTNGGLAISESECNITAAWDAIVIGASATDGFHCGKSKLYLNGEVGIRVETETNVHIADSLVSINAVYEGICETNRNTNSHIAGSQIWMTSQNNAYSGIYNKHVFDSLIVENGYAELEGDATLKAGAALPAETELTIPEGASLTVPAGMTLSVPGGIVNNGALTVDGTLELPETMTKDQVLALGITGEGEIKAGNIHITPSGDCITHNFLEDVCDCGAVSLTAFTNITLRTYITENFDTDMDGALSPEEIANVTEIINEDLRVTTLAGITYLTNLEILFLNGTALTDTTLDFSMLSRLYLLDLSGAYKLESLDVSGCTELADLHLDRCTSLAALDLSNNLQLHGLKVGNTSDLTSLDLSVHKNLEYIDLNASNLKALKLHPDADVEIWGETYYSMQHCGVGYVDLGSIVSDLSQIVKVDYGTLGEDGWVKLDAGKTYFIYYTESGNANAPLPHGVSIYTPADNAHIFIDQIVSKDETGHYTQSCAICRTGSEESAVEAHKYYSLPERNETHHWQYCDDCGYERREAHIFAADCDESCNYCGVGPTFPEEMHNIIDYKNEEDTGYHQGYCTECRDYVYYRHTYEFACSESCKHCGTVNPDAAAHTEQYVAHGNGTHDKFCSVCAKVFEDRVTCTDSDTNAICDSCGAFTFPGSGTEQDPYQVDAYNELVAACIDNAFVKLVGDIEWIRGANVRISGTTHLCLNGYTLNFANSSIRVLTDGVLTVCNCAENAGTVTAYVIPIFNEGGTLVLSGDPVVTNDPERSGGKGAVAMYSGAKIDAADYAGGDVTVELVRMTLGDVIVENVTEANWDKFKVTTRGYTLEQTEEGTLVMAKATPTADIFNFTPPTNLNACDGLAKEAAVTVKQGIEGVGSITIKYFKDGNPLAGAPATVGTYTVKIEVAEGVNYKPATLTDEAWIFTFDITDEAAHTGVMLVSNGNETHDKFCTVCEKVIESGITCSGTTTDDCDKGYKCACGDYFGTKEHNFTIPGQDSTDHWNECSDCGAIDEKIKHSAIEDGDCTTDDLCSVCGAVVVAASESHCGGNATCTEKAECEVCGTAYGELADHSYGEDGKCVCGAEAPAKGDGEEELGFFARLWNAIVWLFWLVVNFFAGLFGIAKA